MTEPRLDPPDEYFDENDAYEAVDQYLREAQDVVETIALHWHHGRDLAADTLVNQLANEIDAAEVSQGWLGFLTIRALVADEAAGADCSCERCDPDPLAYVEDWEQ